nr:hypothetical protein [Nitrosomonas nitrosa]
MMLNQRLPAVVLLASILAPSSGAQSTLRVSVASTGEEANGPSKQPSVSTSGSVVAFTSTATNLVPADTNGVSDVFVHDASTAQTFRVSVDSAGAEGNGVSEQPSISGDGRFVAFRSAADNLVPGDTNGLSDIFVHDLLTGTTERASVATNGDQLTAASSLPFLDEDGSSLAFVVGVSNLGQAGIYMRDRQALTTVPRLTRVAPESVTRPWLSANGNTLAAWGYKVIDFGAGGYVGYVTSSPTGPSGYYVFGGAAWDSPNTRSVAVSADAKFAVLQHDAPLSGSSTLQMNVYVRSLTTGSMACESLTLTGDGAGASNGTLSGNGSLVAFESTSPYLIPTDTGGTRDIFVRDRIAGRTARVSGGNGALQSNGGSYNAMLAAGGGFIVFESDASNLVSNDTNGMRDIFLVNLALTELSLYAYCTAGTTVHGCVPSIAGVGSPSATSTSGFDIVVSNVPGQRYGTMFYGFYPFATPWAPGSLSYQCIAAPVQRFGVQDTGGVAGQCNGELHLDFNAWRAANPGALGNPFVAGQVFHAQGWFRDPGAPKQTNLSDGLRFVLCD